MKFRQVNPKERHVIIVENFDTPPIFRDALANALLMRMSVPSISFFPAEVCATIPLAINTALVIDCGLSYVFLLLLFPLNWP